MNKRSSAASLFAAAILALPASVTAQTWTGAADDGLWANPANWIGGVPNLSTALVTFPAAGSHVLPIDLGPSIFGNQIDVGVLNFSSVPGDVSLTNTLPGGVLRIYGSGLNGIVTSGSSNRTVTINNDILFMSNGLLLNSTGTGAAQVYNGTLRSNVSGGAIVLTGQSNALNPAITINGMIRNGPTGQFTRLEGGYTPDGANHRAIARLTNDANDFTGWVWIKSNTFQVTSVANLGAPSAIGAGGTGDDAHVWLGDGAYTGALDYVGTAPAGHSTNRAIRVYGTSGGGTVLANGAGPLVLNGPVDGFLISTSSKSFTLGGSSTADNRVGGVIGPAAGSGVLNVVKSGSGKWTLTAANTYDGSTTINAGELVLQGAAARIGAVAAGALSINGGGTFRLNGGTVRATDLNNTGTLIWHSGTIELINNNVTTGAGGFVIGDSGPGRLTLAGLSQRFTNVTLHDSDDSVILQSGGTYEFTNLDNSAGGVVAGVAGPNLQINGGVFTHNVAGSAEFRSRIQGTGGLTKQGAGRLRFEGNSHTYTGPTRIEGGTISLSTAFGGTPALSDTSPVFIASGAALDVSARAGGEEIGPLSGGGTVVVGALNPIAVDVASGSATFAGTITGPDRFIKRGAGRQILTGPSDHTGRTDVEGGVLEIATGGSISGTSEVIYSTSSSLVVSGGVIDTAGKVRPVSNSGALTLTDGLIKAQQIDRTINTQYLSPFTWTCGTVHLLSGTTINGSTTTAANRPFAGSLTLDSDMALIIDDTFSVTNSGVFNVNGGSVTADTIVTGGSISFHSGVMRMRNDQTFDSARLTALDLDQLLDAGKTLIVDGVATFDAPLAIAGGSFSAGMLVNPDNLILNKGSLIVTNGALSVAAATSVDSSSGMNITATGGLQVAATGAFNTVGTSFTGTTASVSDGEINAINSTLDFGGGLTSNGALNLINTTVNGAVQTNGVVEVGGTGTFSGDVSGTGDFAGGGTTRFDGSYSPAGGAAAQVGFAGNLVLGAGNTLVVDLGGTMPGTEHDQLLVGGTASLGGTLDIGLIGPFVPTAGDSFTILSASSVNGAFAAVDGREVNPTTWLATIYEPDAVRLAVARGGDATLDGVVNLADFNRLASNFGSTGADWLMADFNGDGLVNLADFNILAANFGMGASGPDVTPQDWANLAAIVPEPGAATGVVVLGSWLMGRRRRSGR